MKGYRNLHQFVEKIPVISSYYRGETDRGETHQKLWVSGRNPSEVIKLSFVTTLFVEPWMDTETLVHV